MATLPIDFNTLNFFSALTNAKIFDDLSSAVGAYNVIDDSRIYTDDIDVLIELGQNTPSLTGGSKTGTNVKSLSSDIEGKVTASDIGTLSLVPAGTFTYALLNALGVNVTTNDTIKEKISQALTALYGITIGTAEVNNYYIKTVIKNGITYSNDKLVKKLCDILYDLGVFSKGDVEVVYDWDNITAGSYSRDYFTYTNPFLIIKNFLSIMLLYSSYNLIGISDNIIISILNDFYNRSGLNADVLIFISLVYDLQKSRAYLKLAKLDSANVYISVSNDFTGFRYHSNSQICYTGAQKTYWEYVIYSPTNTNSSWAFSSTNSTSSSAGYHYTTVYYDAYLFQVWGSNANTTVIDRPAVEGIDEQPNATTPASNDIDVQVNFPTWYNAGIDIGMYNKEISDIAHGRLLPIDVQAEDTTASTFTKAQDVAWQGAIAQEAENAITVGANELLDSLVNASTDIKVIPTDTATPNNDNTGFPILATGTKTGLANVYNPTHEEMAQIKSALWQSNIIEVISTLFKNNPMDAVIGCIALYATPTVGSKKSVILGTVDTGVDSYEVTNQYITINCGSVSVSELYGDARDYAPYTSVSIYLPFVGICDLNANDVIGGDLYVTYKIDVLTGICLVELRVVKYGANQLLYTFTGNCAVQIPLTGQDYSRQIEQALQSIITGAAIIGAGTSFGGASSSSALAPLGYAGSAGGLEATVSKGAMYAGGASIAKGVSNGAFAKPNVMRAGSLGGNAGAMGVKKPYLIINRQLPYDAENYNKLYGYPSNEYIKLSTLTGFTRVKDVHVEGIACTDNEKILIENALKDGVLL